MATGKLFPGLTHPIKLTMKINHNKRTIYVDDDTRCRYIFLWTPLTLPVDYRKQHGEKETRWLEWAWVNEDYTPEDIWNVEGWFFKSWTHSPY